MSFLQWRRFNFFDKETVKRPNTTVSYDQLKNVNITACSSGRGQIIVGDNEGNLHFIDRQLDISIVRAYVLRVSHVFQLKQNNILVTVGEDEVGINPRVKVWNLDKLDKSGAPTCARILPAIPGNTPSPVQCIAVHENLNYMALGFENGDVVLLKGDVTKDRLSKQRIVYQTQRAITGLALRMLGNNIVLYISTEHRIVCIQVTNKDKDKIITLDQQGCKLQCSVLSDASQDFQFVTGRSEAVYFYTPDGRGPCLAFEGVKFRLHWYRSYLVIVGEEKSMPMSNVCTTQGPEMNNVTVYDIQNKFIAYSAPVPGVIDVLCEWGSLYLLAGDGKLYQLQEKDTQTKLDLLFKKNLYAMAINLANTQQYDPDGLMEIHRQYGDHLYQKGDYDGAIDEYIKTIGKLEASYVIRKILDAQRIHNLTAYLQALHKHQQANEDHTTLLLNCYTKLKDESKLDQFIMTMDKEVDFHVETAIKVCRQAGYFHHALYLAEKHRQHDLYLKVQLDDIKDYRTALKYIGKLEFVEAEANLKTHGKILMTEVPQQTTELLKRLCTDYIPSDRATVDYDRLHAGELTINSASSDEFLHIFVKNSPKLTEFLEHMTNVKPNSPSLLYDTLLELYLQDVVHENDITLRKEKERKTLDLLQNPNAGYDANQALILCKTVHFEGGILYLYEKARLYHQLVKHHMDNNEYIQVIVTCKRFGQQDPSLWIIALSYFANKQADRRPQMMEVLAHIDKNDLLPPQLVIRALSHNSGVTLGLIKDYIIHRIQSEADRIAEDERLIKQYQMDTERMRKQIDDMKTSATIFQAAKCSVCNHPLELPSVHFLCQHSYHMHCFEGYAENDSECPACMPENRKILEIIRAQEHGRNLHEQFHHQLESTDDGFSVVADYFGRGVFNKVMLSSSDEGSLAALANLDTKT